MLIKSFSVTKNILKINFEKFKPLTLMAMRLSTLIIKFLLTLYIAKYLSFETLGLYGLISAATIIAPVIFGFGINVTICRNAVTAKISETVSELKFYLRCTIIVYSVLVASCIGYEYFYLGDYKKTFIVTLVIFIMMFEHLGTDCYRLLINKSRPFSANILHFIRTAIWALIYMLFATIFPELRTFEALLLFWLVGTFLPILIFTFMHRNWPWKKSISSRSFLTWLANEFLISRSLYVTELFKSVGVYSDRYIITFFLGLQLTGVYIFFVQICSAISNLVQASVIDIARPKLVLACSSIEQDVFSLMEGYVKKATVICISLSLLSAIFTYYILPALNRPIAIEYFYILPCLLISLIFDLIIQSRSLIYYALRKDFTFFKISAANVFIKLYLLPIFTIYFGLLGSVLSMILTSILTLVLVSISLREFKKPILN